MHNWSHLCLQKRAVQQVVLPIAKHAYLMRTPVQLWLCMVHLQNNHRQVKNLCSALVCKYFRKACQEELADAAVQHVAAGWAVICRRWTRYARRVKGEPFLGKGSSTVQ